MLKLIICIISLFLCCSVYAKELVYLVTDLAPEDGKRKADLVSCFVNYMSDELADKYEFRYQHASREQ